MRWFKIFLILAVFSSLLLTTFMLNLNFLNFYNIKTATIISHFVPYFGNNVPEIDIDRLYNDIGLENIMDKNLFEKSMMGYSQIVGSNIVKKKSLLTIIDYSKPSSEKRLYVIDVKSRKLLFNSLVAHGKNSGENYANLFSNELGSLKSSLGFYITMGTYEGDNGYSLKLRGLEKDFNEMAEKRLIVMHGADYVSDDYIKEYGRIGRSWGCPAVPLEIAASLIDTIKEGSPLFIYSDDKKYLSSSKFVNIVTASDHPAAKGRVL